MTGKGDRKHPETPYDKTRGNVALAKLATALGVRLKASDPDHVILEQLAEAAERAWPVFASTSVGQGGASGGNGALSAYVPGMGCVGGGGRGSL